jgi:hypothetical protein
MVGPVIRLWEISWRSNGWEPVLLLPRLARANRNFQEEPPKNHAHKCALYWKHALLAFDMQRCQGVLVDFRTINVSFSSKNLPRYKYPYRLSEESPGLFLPARRGWDTCCKIRRGTRLRALSFIVSFPGRGPLVAFHHQHRLKEMLSLGPYALESA